MTFNKKNIGKVIKNNEKVRFGLVFFLADS